MDGSKYDLSYDATSVNAELVVETWVSHGPRASDPAFDPRAGDWVIVGDDDEPPIGGRVLRRDGDKVWVQLDPAGTSTDTPRLPIPLLRRLLRTGKGPSHTHRSSRGYMLPGPRRSDSPQLHSSLLYEIESATITEQLWATEIEHREKRVLQGNTTGERWDRVRERIERELTGR